MKRKVYICLSVIVALLIIGGFAIYYAMPKYIVYAVRASDGEFKLELVYTSIFRDKAEERYYYLNQHKEEGVKGYILKDTSTGLRLIPF